MHDGSMTRRPGASVRARLATLVLATLGAAVALLLAETLTRRLSIDQRLITPSLFFQGSDVEVHRVSADPALHYELAPGTSCECAVPGRPPYRVTIDAHGARHPTHPLVKQSGVYRILCVGGSTIYGGAVSDDETIPAALERHLNAEVPDGRRYEAWNLGTSAYMLRQAAHVAETRLDEIRPDLVVVQLYNEGRRAFLIPPSYKPLDYDWSALLGDPDFFTEQFAYPSWLPVDVVEPWLRRSALARATIALVPGFGHRRDLGWCQERDHEAARAL